MGLCLYTQVILACKIKVKKYIIFKSTISPLISMDKAGIKVASLYALYW